MPSVPCSCGKTIEVKDEWAGAFIRCRGCGAKVYVPTPSDAPAEADFRPCPFCAEPIRKQAIKCRYCGQSLVLRRAGASIAARPRRAEPRVDTGGTGVLVMAILGWVFCGIFHPIAWAMGISHEAKCRAQGMEPSGAAKAGKIMGMVGTILMIVVVLLVVVILAIAGMG